MKIDYTPLLIFWKKILQGFAVSWNTPDMKNHLLWYYCYFFNLRIAKVSQVEAEPYLYTLRDDVKEFEHFVNFCNIKDEFS